MSYPDSVRYLYSLGNELKAGAKFGLERMHTILAALGSPETGQRFVHVAGTNGKGSTSAFIASILRQSGMHTGLYTSPHLIEPTERIQIDGSNVMSGDFADAFRIVHEAAEELLRSDRIDAHPSYFETVTAMALLLFRTRVDISVIEVGLGGRLDATNVIAPELCVIAPVSYDHEAYLGNTLSSIAGEKAGILKPRCPVVTAKQEKVVDAILGQRAKELCCQEIRLADSKIQVQQVTPHGSQFSLDGIPYDCNLPGRHQIENAATAVLASRQLGMKEVDIQEGLRKARWPGRLELVARDPDFVLDGAHNPAGAAALARYIREFYLHRSVWLVYGAMRDKAIEEVTECLFPLAQRLILTAPDFARALRPQAILDVTQHPNVTLTNTVPEAIQIARAAPAGTAVFFAGSLYLVGEARSLLVDQHQAVS